MKYFLVFLTIGLTWACDFKAVIQSETEHELWAQFTFHNKTQSELMQFSSYGQNKTVPISGKFCNFAPTILKAWSKYPKKDDKPLGETSAYLEGMGVMYYKLHAKTGPSAVRADRMICAFGQCRGRK
ncbi:unnamed protein product [Caenorhabditis angaria]|uniref:Uncharacterized protein n=1 Tax=Caenorhabditis angaria TaxID=860376 RepID=A0A9P1N4G6_9PELO|nr:unnamed protein product [Caenorhabditis angaria]